MQTLNGCNSNEPYLLDDGQGHQVTAIPGEVLMGDYVIRATNMETGEPMALQYLAPEEYPRMTEVLKAFDERCAGACVQAKQQFTLGKMYERLAPVQDHVYVMDLWPVQTFEDVYKGSYDIYATAAELLKKTLEIAGLARVLVELGYVHLDIYSDTIFVKDDGALLLASIEEVFPLENEGQVNRMLELISQLPLAYPIEVEPDGLPHMRLGDDVDGDTARLQEMVQKARSGEYLKNAEGEELQQRALSAVDRLIADLNALREMIAVPTGQSH